MNALQAELEKFPAIADLSERIRSKEISPVELTEASLARIGALDGALHAFITVCSEEALRQARDAEKEIVAGRYRGPLHGIPYAVKDVYQTKGIRTTAHSYALEHWVPNADAATVEKMRDAGAILAGKLATFEFSTGAIDEGPFPPARNPWNLEYTPMGSSSGAGAAVAAGMIAVALGGDTGGSVRLPAAACGCVGMRPTYGRVSRHGIIPLSWSLDAPGPLTRNVRDCAIVMRAISGFDPRDTASAQREVPDYEAELERPVRGLRVGIERTHFFDSTFVDPIVIEAVDRAIGVLQDQGAQLVAIELPALDHVHAAQNVIHMAESHAYQAPRLLENPHGYGKSVRNYFRLGAFLTSRDYLQAQRIRSMVRSEMLRAFERVDVIASPTISHWAERFDEVDTGTRFGKLAGKPNLMVPFSNAGVPAITVPCGFSPEGLPLGLQIAGRPFDEATILRTAFAYEQATPWHDMHPNLT